MNEDKETRKRREYVAGLYSGPIWKNNVARMPAHQITAIYLRTYPDGPKLPSKNGKKPKTLSNPEQLSLLGDDMEPQEPEFREARPLPCPECNSTKGYSRVGNYRSQCLNCNALLKNAEVNQENLKPE
jgi:hypothetical protein